MSAPRVVVLAAGRGSRLGALTDGRAKTCQPLGDTDLLGRQRRQFAARGLGEVTVVVGHAADHVRARHPDVRTVTNPAWANTGSAASLACAASVFAGGAPVLLSHGDLAFDDRVLDALLDATRHGASATLLDGSWRAQTGDEVLGWSDADGRLAGVRKGPADPGAAGSGEYVGLTLWQPDAAAAFLAAGAGRAPEEDYEQPRLNDFVAAGGGPLRAVVIHDLPWWNVNHPEDLRAARAAFAPDDAQAEGLS